MCIPWQWSWQSCPRQSIPATKNTPSVHHTRRWNMTTSVVRLRNKSHMQNFLQKSFFLLNFFLFLVVVLLLSPDTTLEIMFLSYVALSCPISEIVTVRSTFEDKVGAVWGNVDISCSFALFNSSLSCSQSKVTGSKSTDDIDAAFQEAKEQEAGSPQSESAPGSEPPTEKVPL